MGHFREELQTINFFLAFQRHLLVRLQPRPIGDNSRFGSLHQADCQGCQWQKESEEERMIDLLYHATIYYEICKYIQELEPATLKYKMVIEKAKAHEHNILEYKDHQASHGEANSVPSCNNPLLTAHALTKRRPSGQNACHHFGKSHE